MQTAPITRRQRAQRARRDAEREASPRQGPPLIPHGTPVGEVIVRLHGQEVRAVLLQAGERCRSYGVSIDGAAPVLMGLYAAGAKATAKIARMPSRRSDFWGDA